MEENKMPDEKYKQLHHTIQLMDFLNSGEFLIC